MGVYDPNATPIAKPTKLSAPVMVGGEHVWEEPYNRIQLFGSVFPYLGKWRMFYIWQYGLEASGNKLWKVGYAEAATPSGPWTKPLVGVRQNLLSNVVINDQQSFGVYFDQYVGKYRGAGGYICGESANGTDWTSASFPAGPKNDTSVSLIRHQPFSPNNGLPFVATTRSQGTWENGTLRRQSYMDSGDFVNWSEKQVITQFDSPDGWEQPYALQLTSYGDKIVGLLWWIHLDNVSGNNDLGTVDAELVWLDVPQGATTIADCGSWNRTNQAFLSVGDSGAFDAGQVEPASLVIENGTVYVFYTAYKQKHGVPIQPNDCSIGLATMPQSQLDDILEL